MADYINLSILSQAYIHIEPIALSGKDLDLFRDALTDYASLRSKFFLHPDVDIDVTLSHGSLKSKATIYGTITALYLGIGNYGDFRGGISAAYEDVKRVAEAVSSESLFLAKARKPQILRVEARTGVVGQIKKLITELDSLERNVGTTSPEDMVKKIARARLDAERLLSNIHDVEDLQLVGSELREIAKLTPAGPAPSRRKQVDFEALVGTYRDDRRALLKLLSDAAAASA